MRRSAWDWAPTEEILAKDVRVCTSTNKAVSMAYRVVGCRTDTPVLLLLCGLNSNMEMYHPAFVDALAAAGPFRVVYLDNRDTGNSTHFSDCAVSSVATFFLPRCLGVVKAPYTLGDMADDAAAVLDHLGADRAVVMGSSMGGMLAQTFALRHASRTIALVSVNSTSHGPGLPDPTLRTKMGFLRKPKDDSASAIKVLKQQWCLDFGIAPSKDGRADFADYFGVTAARMVDRSRFDGFQRQMAAIMVAPSRDGALQSVTCPSLVIAGAHDVVVLPAHSYRTAACLPNAKLLTLGDSGHVVDPDNSSRIAEAVAELHRLAVSA